MSSRAWIVSDLGWGDSGKGTTVDFLVRERKSRLVVRWNGGSQAGHRVVDESGRAHVFAQFGAGTFVPGVRTHLAETVLVDPCALEVEARHLGRNDALERLSIAASARIITPFHVAANHLREAARGRQRHGTCGCGIGETVRDALDHPDGVLRAHHLVGERATFARRLEDVQERILVSLDEELRALRGDTATRNSQFVLKTIGPPYTDEFLDRIRGIAPARVIDDDAIDRSLGQGEVILEGAQGVLLDQDVGVTPPHVTWSRCTTYAANEWLDAHGFRGPRTALGVMRTYATRHGQGPFPTEAPELASLLPEPAAWNTFQGAFRVGWLDLERLQYAIAASPIDALVVTHLDRLAVLPSRPGVPSDPDEWLRFIADALGKPVAIASSGPTAGEKRWIEPMMER